jgi:hypothetical protein
LKIRLAVAGTLGAAWALAHFGAEKGDNPHLCEALEEPSRPMEAIFFSLDPRPPAPFPPFPSRPCGCRDRRRSCCTSWDSSASASWSDCRGRI